MVVGVHIYKKEIVVASKALCKPMIKLSIRMKQTVYFVPVFCRSSCKVISTQALQYGHMLTPEAGNTQWMEEHEEEACGLLRKPLGLGSFNIPRIVVEIVLFQKFKLSNLY